MLSLSLPLSLSLSLSLRARVCVYECLVLQYYTFIMYNFMYQLPKFPTIHNMFVPKYISCQEMTLRQATAYRQILENIVLL